MDGGVDSLAVFDDGSGLALYAGGWFTMAGDVPAHNIAKWDGESWSPLGSGMGGTDHPTVSTLAVFDDGTGEALYAGGWFTTAGGVTVNRVAKWDGTVWTPLSGGMSAPIHALTVYDEGFGPALYASGDFWVSPGGDRKMARWRCSPPCIGDVNGDGVTDQSDLGIVLASYGVDAGGDLNGDGITDQADLGILLADYGCGT